MKDLNSVKSLAPICPASVIFQPRPFYQFSSNASSYHQWNCLSGNSLHFSKLPFCYLYIKLMLRVESSSISSSSSHSSSESERDWPRVTNIESWQLFHTLTYTWSLWREKERRLLIVLCGRETLWSSGRGEIDRWICCSGLHCFLRGEGLGGLDSSTSVSESWLVSSCVDPEWLSSCIWAMLS